MQEATLFTESTSAYPVESTFDVDFLNAVIAGGRLEECIR